MNTATKFLVALTLFLLWLPAANAQEVRATLTGIVTDPSGAPAVGATVTAINVKQNVPVKTETNAAGNYVLPFLSPGKYILTVELRGFKKFIRRNIVLQAQEKARVDVKLQLGTVTESITVSAAMSQLQTETANRSQVISNKLISQLPTQGRNPFQLAWAASGVIKAGSWRYLRSLDIAGTTHMSINGGRKDMNEVLLDGISDVRGNSRVIEVPTMESVQEFKVLSNTYDAQYGRTGGGIVTIVTKQGGNSFHGSMFEYFQNNHLNANTSELNRAGRGKAAYHLNDFGFEMDGPIYVPHVIDGRNKLFWMVSYEGIRQRTADPRSETFPLMDWRKGDFSTAFTNQGQPQIIYDPLTTNAEGIRQPFPGNRIPNGRINPIAQAVMKYYPAPLWQGEGPAHINNYITPGRWTGSLAQWIGRADYVVNSNNRIYFRYGENPWAEYRGMIYPTDSPAEPGGQLLIRNGRNWTLNWSSIISPTMTFNLRTGLNRWEETGGNSFRGNFNPLALGFDPSLVGQFTHLRFPAFDLGTYARIGNTRAEKFSGDNTYSLQPSIGLVVGKHYLKFGFEARQYKDSEPNSGLASGRYLFNKNWTQQNALQGDVVSGNELATFLLGYPSAAWVDHNIDPTWLHRYYAWYVNDTWKMTPRLTVTLGLRWDYEAPGYERFNRMVRGFDFNTPSPIANQVSGLDLKGAVLFAGVNGQPRTVVNPDKNNFQPRIGVAYRIGDNWVIRGGYGIYYLPQSLNGSLKGFSRTTHAVVSTDGGLTPAVSVTNAFANLPGGKLLQPIGSSEGAASFLGESIPAYHFNRPLPYSQQFSIDIQRQLPRQFLLEVGYSGNITRELPVNTAVDVIPTSDLARRTPAGSIDTNYYTMKVPNPMAGVIPNNPNLNDTTIPNRQLMLPYPQYTGISLNSIPIGKARSDSFNIKITKRYSNGLSFLANYSFMKNLEQVSFLNPQDFVMSNAKRSPLEKRSAGTIDIPQKFVFAGLYELPFGRQKMIGAGWSPVLDAVLGGWQINADVTYQSGWVVNYPNAAQAVPGSAKLNNPTFEEWFNTSLWNDPNTGARVPRQEPFTLRNFPTRFSDVRVPGYQNWDASVSKSFPIRETMKLQFRFDMINAFNHPWFPNITTGVTNSSFGRLDPTQRNLPRNIKLALVLSW